MFLPHYYTDAHLSHNCPISHISDAKALYYVLVGCCCYENVHKHIISNLKVQLQLADYNTELDRVFL